MKTIKVYAVFWYWRIRFAVKTILPVYPWCHILTHPILTLLVAYDYRQRRLGKRPDRWYWADEKLFFIRLKG